MWFNREGSLVKGEWTGEAGWARFVGKYLADFALNKMNQT
jgi:hypothetical protein